MDEDRMSALLETARGDSAISALHATVRLRKEIERLESVHVRHARVAGATWAEIATILGVSKQAVHKKYGGKRKEH